MNYTKSEQETFLHREAIDPKKIVLETSEPNEIRRVLEIAAQGGWEILSQEKDGDRVTFVRAQLADGWSLGFKPRKKQVMSPERKQAAIERLAKARASKN